MQEPLVLEGDLGFYSEDAYCAMDVMVDDRDVASAIASHFFGLPPDFEGWRTQTAVETGSMGHSPRLGRFRVTVERLP